MRSSRLLAVASSTLASSFATMAIAQPCPVSVLNLSSFPRPGNVVRSMTTWTPPGSQSPLMIAGGDFLTLSDGVEVGYVAAWNGSQWSTLSGGLAFGTGQVSKLLPLSDGTLLATGNIPPQTPGDPFSRAAAVYNGTSWQLLQLVGNPPAAVEWNGSIYFGGSVSTAPGVGEQRVVVAGNLGMGPASPIGIPLNGNVRVLAIFNNELIAGGEFTAANATVLNYIARWNGIEWLPLNGGVAGTQGGVRVNALRVHEGQLIVGGRFNSAGGVVAVNVAAWNGSAWSNFGFLDVVNDFTVDPQGVIWAAQGLGQSGQLSRRIGGAWVGVSGFQQGAAWTATPYQGAIYVGGDFLGNGGLQNVTWSANIEDVAPSITQQPSPASACVNQFETTFQISTPFLSPVPAFQWRRDGVLLTDGFNPWGSQIFGATTRQLVIQFAKPQDAGLYTATALNNCGTAVSNAVALTVPGPGCPAVCDSIDFNRDGSLFDPTDIDAFFSVFSEGPCIPAGATCNDIDFNNDGSLFDPCDIDSFLLVFSEGPCTHCGV